MVSSLSSPSAALHQKRMLKSPSHLSAFKTAEASSPRSPRSPLSAIHSNSKNLATSTSYSKLRPAGITSTGAKRLSGGLTSPKFSSELGFKSPTMKRLRKDRGSTGGLVGRIDENENSEIDNNSNSNNCESSSGDKENSGKNNSSNINTSSSNNNDNKRKRLTVVTSAARSNPTTNPFNGLLSTGGPTRVVPGREFEEDDDSEVVVVPLPKKLATTTTAATKARVISIMPPPPPISQMDSSFDSVEEFYNNSPKNGNNNCAAKKWSVSDFTIGKALGRGKFGNVYMAKEKMTKCSLALKVMFKNQLSVGTAPLLLRREVEIQCRLDHPCILRLFGYFCDPTSIFLILEEATGGEVYKLMSDAGGRLKEEVARRYIKDVAKALLYLKQKHVLHRDIKPENLLIGSDGIVKLSDFGWAIHAPPPVSKRTTLCGTAEYVPPEMLIEKSYDETVDNWSLGVLAYEFVVGKTPFRVSTKGWGEMDDQVYKKKLHESIFNKVKGWDEDEGVNKVKLFDVAAGIDRAAGVEAGVEAGAGAGAGEAKGRRASGSRWGEEEESGPYSLISENFRAMIGGLLRRRGKDRIGMEQVLEILEKK